MKSIIFVLSIISLIAVLLPGPLFKYNITGLAGSFGVLGIGALLAIVSIILVGVQFFFYRPSIQLISTIVSTAFACIALSIPLGLVIKAKQVPPIHDITTDVVNVPMFDVLLSQREGALNPASYDHSIAPLQQQAYPDIATRLYKHNKQTLVEAIKTSLEILDLNFINYDENKGLIEATHQSNWFGFVDDVAIRLEESEMSVKVDIRSKSRVGRSDLGQNAQRIRSIFDQLDQQLN